MKHLLVAAICLVSSSAFARPHHSAPIKTIDQMTCAEAQAFGKKHGYIMARGAGNDAPVPIYPVAPDKQYVSCGKGEPTRPYFMAALDTEDCIINWVCGL